MSDFRAWFPDFNVCLYLYLCSTNNFYIYFPKKQWKDKSKK